jgi:hypothetical protein
MCFCVLCNQEVNQKSYTRHIDKCFIRVKTFLNQKSLTKHFKSSSKVKYHMDPMLNRISKVYFVIITIERIIFIVKD